MDHFDFQETEVSKIYIDEYSSPILCKRDDRFTSGLGGSKARMLKYILYPVKQNGVEVVLTAGGPCSNFNRALSVYCAELNIRLRIVSYTDNKEQYSSSLNFYISRKMGAEYIFCEKSEVLSTLETEKNKLAAEGRRYEYIYGGAEGNVAGMMAYYEAVSNLRNQVQQDISHIFVPCGTGTTTTGICAGAQEFFPNAIVHSVSVARNKAAEMPILESNIQLFNSKMNSHYTLRNLCFHDEFLMGGYASDSEKLWQVINNTSKNTGILLDPIYSGKAFMGMIHYLHTVKSDDTVLFWNTGGLINHLSQAQI